MRISQWKMKVIFTVAYLGVVGLLYKLGVSCLFQQFLGVRCPGCGMTRAMLSVLHLDLKAAFGYHPMFWSMPILYLYFLLDNGLFRNKIWDRVVLFGILVGVAVSWIVRIV